LRFEIAEADPTVAIAKNAAVSNISYSTSSFIEDISAFFVENVNGANNQNGIAKTKKKKKGEGQIPSEPSPQQREIEASQLLAEFLRTSPFFSSPSFAACKSSFLSNFTSFKSLSPDESLAFVSIFRWPCSLVDSGWFMDLLHHMFMTDFFHKSVINNSTCSSIFNSILSEDEIQENKLKINETSWTAFVLDNWNSTELDSHINSMIRDVQGYPFI